MIELMKYSSSVRLVYTIQAKHVLQSVQNPSGLFLHISLLSTWGHSLTAPVLHTCILLTVLAPQTSQQLFLLLLAADGGSLARWRVNRPFPPAAEAGGLGICFHFWIWGLTVRKLIQDNVLDGNLRWKWWKKTWTAICVGPGSHWQGLEHTHTQFHLILTSLLTPDTINLSMT